MSAKELQLFIGWSVLHDVLQMRGEHWPVPEYVHSQWSVNEVDEEDSDAVEDD